MTLEDEAGGAENDAPETGKVILRIKCQDMLGRNFSAETTVSTEDNIIHGIGSIPRMLNDRLRGDTGLPIRYASLTLIDPDGAHIMINVKYPVGTPDEVAEAEEIYGSQQGR